MATNAHTARARAWKIAYTKYLNLNQRLELAPPHEREKLERAVAAQLDELLDLNAPSFAAVRQKLEMLWEGELESPDRASEEKRLIIEDLSDLCTEAAMTIGSE
jgi:hypothetical protein